MVYIKRFPLLLLLAYPLYIKGNDGQCRDLKSEIVRSLTTGNEKIMSMVSGLTNLVKSQTEIIKAQEETIQELQQDMKYLRKCLDERLRENELKVEWALTDGTLAPKNTSGIIKNLTIQMHEVLELLIEVHGYNKSASTPFPHISNKSKGKDDLPGNCAEINGSGVHSIYPNHSNSYQVLVNCDKTAGGGWTVIQKRFDGSVDFYREWDDYVEGFGDPAGEYWLGLRHIHALTKDQPMELYVGVTDFDLGLRYAKYTSFSVSSEEDKFKLHIETYSGNAGDSLTYHNGSRFSTRDQDNDSSGFHCATKYHGAWWYNSCHYANLNGLFSAVEVDGWSYMNWRFLQNAKKAMKSSVVMIRPSNFKT